MNILGIIPARGGSEGIPDKNIKLLNGKPLIFYTINQAKTSKKLSKIIVSTDSEKIAKLSLSLGVEVPFLRPKNLALNHSPAIEYVLHAIEYFENIGEVYEAVCILQPTSPYRPKGAIDDAIELFLKSDADTLLSVRKVPTHYNPHWVFFRNDDNLLTLATGEEEIITRRQELPASFHRDGAIYITKIDTIKNEKKLIGKKIIGYLINSPELINIDTNEDWEIAIKYIK